MKHHTTEKGTELPISNIKGKDYLEVKYRLLWFREEKPTWSIETKIVEKTDRSATVQSTIRNEEGRLIAMSHKSETQAGFPDFLEKAETGAIGRALALIGYGTQFCGDELDEKERLADAPIDRGHVSAPQAAPAESGLVCDRCGSNLRFSTKSKGYYCPNFKDKRVGEHTYVPAEEVASRIAPPPVESDIPF